MAGAITGGRRSFNGGFDGLAGGLYGGRASGRVSGQAAVRLIVELEQQHHQQRQGSRVRRGVDARWLGRQAGAGAGLAVWRCGSYAAVEYRDSH